MDHVSHNSQYKNVHDRRQTFIIAAIRLFEIKNSRHGLLPVKIVCFWSRNDTRCGDIPVLAWKLPVTALLTCSVTSTMSQKQEFIQRFTKIAHIHTQIQQSSTASGFLLAVICPLYGFRQQ